MKYLPIILTLFWALTASARNHQRFNGSIIVHSMASCGNLIEGMMLEDGYGLMKICLAPNKIGDSYKASLQFSCNKAHGFTAGLIKIDRSGIMYKQCLRVSSLDSYYEISNRFKCAKGYRKSKVQYTESSGLITTSCSRR